jgi:hypothetical protein
MPTPNQLHPVDFQGYPLDKTKLQGEKKHTNQTGGFKGGGNIKKTYKSWTCCQVNLRTNVKKTNICYNIKTSTATGTYL